MVEHAYFDLDPLAFRRLRTKLFIRYLVQLSEGSESADFSVRIVGASGPQTARPLERAFVLTGSMGGIRTGAPTFDPYFQFKINRRGGAEVERWLQSFQVNWAKNSPDIDNWNDMVSEREFIGTVLCGHKVEDVNVSHRLWQPFHAHIAQNLLDRFKMLESFRTWRKSLDPEYEAFRELQRRFQSFYAEVRAPNVQKVLEKILK